jgi:diguanylate cyclase (GGDEF)-like protein
MINGVKPIGAERLRNVIDAQRDIMACRPDVEAVMRVTAEWARCLTGASAGVVELVENDEMVYRASAGTAAGSEGLRLKRAESLSGLCVERHEMLYAEDTDLDPRVDRAACKRVGARSMLVVPLFHAEQCVGVLKVYAPSPRAFDEDDAATLSLMVGFISAAMGYAAAHDALLASEKRFRSLAELAVDAIVTLDRSGHITFANRSAQRLFGYDGVQILQRTLNALIPDIDVTTLSVRTRSTMPPPSDSRASVVPPRLIPLLDQLMELTAIHADGSEVPVELAVSASTANGVEQFTAVIRDIRERRRQQAEAIDRLRVDQLTGLLVRRAGNEALRQEAERARRHQHPYSLVLLDLDHFKRVNDNFGHHVGDDLLREVGHVVRQNLRESDIAVRWGGEELLLLLTETPLAGGQECAERIRRAVSMRVFPEVGSVTLSAGVACSTNDEALDAVIDRADERLYAAKRGGRNRVES